VFVYSTPIALFLVWLDFRAPTPGVHPAVRTRYTPVAFMTAHYTYRLWGSCTGARGRKVMIVGQGEGRGSLQALIRFSTV